MSPHERLRRRRDLLIGGAVALCVWGAGLYQIVHFH